MFSKLKKRIADLDLYLGRDDRGKEALKLIKDAANELRKSLQVAVRERDEASEICQRATTENGRLTMRLNEAEQALHSLRQRVSGLERTVESNPTTPKPVTASPGDPMTVIKTLRSRAACLARPKRAFPFEDSLGYAYDLSDISKGWSYAALWLLGATVAMSATLWGSCTVYVPPGERFGKQNMAESFTRQLLRWCRKNIDMNSENPAYAKGD